MFFNSIDFGIFFFLVFVLFWLFFRQRIKLQNIFLIVVSYIFYGWWDWRFLSLIVISSFIDFYTGKKIFFEDDPKKKKHFLLLSLIVNLGFLCSFKYFNFFVDSFVDAFTFFGLSLDGPSIHIILPVGISFYTFQTLSYTLDVYKGKMEPTKDIFGFLAFVSFFPQLVAGPIERAKHLLPQFSVDKKPNYEQFRSGMLLMVWGFFKKIVIADRLARYVDGAYADVANIGGLPIIIAVLFFAFQLYLDFSAYSDIAIGTARLLGFDLMTNFKRPYLSATFSDFWKRWHISLSSWFRDYVYIPLGGSKFGKRATIRNIMIVFLLSGLWHGASWNFVIWGALNGLFLVLFDRILVKFKTTGFQRLLSSLIVSAFWAASLIFFRAVNFSDAISLYSKIGFGNSVNVYNYGLGESEFKFTIWLLIGLIAFEILQEKKAYLYNWFTSLHFTVRWVLYLAIASFILFFGSYGIGLNDNSFIYFQF